MIACQASGSFLPQPLHLPTKLRTDAIHSRTTAIVGLDTGILFLSRIENSSASLRLSRLGGLNQHSPSVVFVFAEY